MANFAECTLIKLVPSEPYFVALTTFDIYHGRSTRFLLRQKDLVTLVNDENAKDIRFHDLRHSFATISLQNGDDIKTVSENLGHSRRGSDFF